MCRVRRWFSESRLMALPTDSSAALWSLVLGPGVIDPVVLATAVDAAADDPHPDFRTRLLFRDAVAALAAKWGEQRTRSALRPAAATRFGELLVEDFGDRGFTTLGRRLVEHTGPETIERFFRELGRLTRDPCRLDVGGSCALMLADLLRRRTDDIDAVDEVPPVLRNQHAALDALTARYDLRLAHFQSHYLPDGWRGRVHSFGVYGSLSVFLVDPLDVLVGKLFSHREKDLDDLRLLTSSFTKEQITDRLRTAGRTLLGEPRDREAATRNWYVLFGDESLPA